MVSIQCLSDYRCERMYVSRAQQPYSLRFTFWLMVWLITVIKNRIYQIQFCLQDGFEGDKFIDHIFNRFVDFDQFF